MFSEQKTAQNNFLSLFSLAFSSSQTSFLPYFEPVKYLLVAFSTNIHILPHLKHTKKPEVYELAHHLQNLFGFFFFSGDKFKGEKKFVTILTTVSSVKSVDSLRKCWHSSSFWTIQMCAIFSWATCEFCSSSVHPRSPWTVLVTWHWFTLAFFATQPVFECNEKRKENARTSH